MKASDEDWSEVVGNLWKARKIWALLSRLLEREGDSTRVLGVFLKAVVQMVMLLGAKTWLITPQIVRDMGGFQHRVARQIMGRQHQQKIDGRWYYPPLETVIQEAGFE